MAAFPNFCCFRDTLEVDGDIEDTVVPQLRARRSRPRYNFKGSESESDIDRDTSDDFVPDAAAVEPSDDNADTDDADDGDVANDGAFESRSVPFKTRLDGANSDQVTPVLHSGKPGENLIPSPKKDSAPSIQKTKSVGFRILEKDEKKLNYCPFCGIGVQRLARHLLTVHDDRDEVNEILSIPKGTLKKPSLERNAKFEILRNRGNYLHNDRTLLSNDGVLVPKKRCESVLNLDNLAYCKDCYGTFNGDTLYRHRQRCPKNPLVMIKGVHSLLQGKMLFAASQHQSSTFSEFRQKVLPVMKKDYLYNIVERDETILLYGTKLLSMHEDQAHLITYITCKCREIARLLDAAMKLDATIKELKQLYHPKNWDTVILAVKKEAGFLPETNTFQTPSLALKIGYILSVISAYLGVKAIKDSDSELEHHLISFTKLMTVEWKDEVARKARKTLHEAKFNKPEAVPMAEDVQKVYTFLKKKLEEDCKSLEDCESPVTWHELAKSTACYVLIFNRRRPGELQRFPIKSYQENKNKELNDEISKCLSNSEKLLAKSLVLVEIRGKRGKKVPVLLNNRAVKAVDLLVNTRTACNIKEDNKYLFAVPGCDSPLRLSECFSEMVKQANVVKPETLTATALRKHVATTCQIMHLDENEVDQLATFMGHNVDVHREYYRLSSNAVQLARVSKIFTLMDQGKISKSQGKKLADIDVDAHETVSLNYSDSSDTDEDEPFSEPSSARAKRGKQVRKRGNAGSLEEEDYHPQKRTSKKGKKRNIPEKKKRGRCEKVLWSVEESNAVKKHLRPFIVAGTVPGKEKCQACIDAEPALCNRDWTSVKYFVKNAITKRKKTGTVSPLKLAAVKLPVHPKK